MIARQFGFHPVRPLDQGHTVLGEQFVHTHICEFAGVAQAVDITVPEEDPASVLVNQGECGTGYRRSRHATGFGEVLHEACFSRPQIAQERHDVSGAQYGCQPGREAGGFRFRMDKPHRLLSRRQVYLSPWKPQAIVLKGDADPKIAKVFDSRKIGS
jgi:hypothetical protein